MSMKAFPLYSGTEISVISLRNSVPRFPFLGLRRWVAVATHAMVDHDRYVAKGRSNISTAKHVKCDAMVDGILAA